jgi:hypothetical protein
MSYFHIVLFVAAKAALFVCSALNTPLAAKSLKPCTDLLAMGAAGQDTTTLGTVLKRVSHSARETSTHNRQVACEVRRDKPCLPAWPCACW